MNSPISFSRAAFWSPCNSEAARVSRTAWSSRVRVSAPSPAPSSSSRRRFSTFRVSRRRYWVGIPFSTRRMAVLKMSATVLTRPGMAESGQVEKQPPQAVQFSGRNLGYSKRIWVMSR